MAAGLPSCFLANDKITQESIPKTNGANFFHPLSGIGQKPVLTLKKDLQAFPFQHFDTKWKPDAFIMVSAQTAYRMCSCICYPHGKHHLRLSFSGQGKPKPIGCNEGESER
ncbi:MAG TPA: hypothetical protein VHS96_14710 [Bacteroidia bacterium]|nr:hypothetical protein [Bacteroidia bacterium]